MSHTMAMKIIRQVYIDVGMGQRVVQGLTYNTCRRFLPTLGNVLDITRHEAQALGNWVEDPTAQQDRPAGPGPSVLPMSVHYSGQRALASGLVKARVVERFLQLLSAVPTVGRIIAGEPGIVDEEAVTWELLAKLHHDTATSHADGSAASSLLPLADPVKDGQKSKEKGKKEKSKKDKSKDKDKKQKDKSRKQRKEKSPEPTLPAPPARRRKLDQRPSFRDR